MRLRFGSPVCNHRRGRGWTGRRIFLEWYLDTRTLFRVAPSRVGRKDGCEVWDWRFLIQGEGRKTKVLFLAMTSRRRKMHLVWIHFDRDSREDHTILFLSQKSFHAGRRFRFGKDRGGNAQFFLHGGHECFHIHGFGDGGPRERVFLGIGYCAGIGHDGLGVRHRQKHTQSKGGRKENPESRTRPAPWRCHDDALDVREKCDTIPKRIS